MIGDPLFVQLFLFALRRFIIWITCSVYSVLLVFVLKFLHLVRLGNELYEKKFNDYMFNVSIGVAGFQLIENLKVVHFGAYFLGKVWNTK